MHKKKTYLPKIITNIFTFQNSIVIQSGEKHYLFELSNGKEIGSDALNSMMVEHQEVQ